jgi:hypothetical protein
MKALRLSLFSAFLGSSAAMGAAIPGEMAGSYQALLYSDTSPSGLLALKVSTKGAVSGKLTTSDKKAYSFKTTLDYTAAAGEDPGVATHTPIEIKGTSLKLTMAFKDLENDTLEAFLTDGGVDRGSTLEGFKVKTYNKGESAATLGSYTMAFELAAGDPGVNDPAGNGYGIGKVDTKGVMKITGKLGDGTAFTAALPNGASNQFALFINPYKRDDSMFGGMIFLSQRDDDLFHAETANFYWQKTATAKDKSYRTSFGLSITAMVEPWTPPAKGSNVASILGIDIDTEVFAINFGFDVPNDRQPQLLGLNAKNALEVKFASQSAPSTFQGNGFAKIFSGKLDPKTGKLTATINLEDAVLINGKTKMIKRKVVIEGVILNFEGELDAFASAFAIIPPLDKKTGTNTTARITFDEIQTDPMIIKGEALAGSYQATFDHQILSVGFPPDGMPANGAVSTFSISSDLRTLTIGGTTLPLKAFDPFGGIILFTDEGFNKKKYDAATIRFDTTTNELIKCDVFYFQFVGVSSNPPTKSGTALSRNNPNTIVKLP